MLSLQQSALRATPLDEMFSLLYPEELFRMHINDFQDETYWVDYRIEKISKDTLDSFLESFYPYNYTRPEEALDFILRILISEGRLIEFSSNGRDSNYFLWYKSKDQYVFIFSDNNNIGRTTLDDFGALILGIGNLHVEYMTEPERITFEPDVAPVLEAMAYTKFQEVKDYKKMLNKNTRRIIGSMDKFTFSPYNRLSRGIITMVGGRLFLLAKDHFTVGQWFRGKEVNMFLGMLTYNETILSYIYLIR